MPEIYYIDLTKVECAPAIWSPVLDDTEKMRADRFRQPRDRLTFIAAHALKRIVLATFFPSQSARALRFSANDFGKPFLLGDAALHFNISHTMNLVALAVSRQATVGIDVEALAGTCVSRDTMQCVLAPDERAALDASPDWNRAFLALWTAKEAVIKAEGLGLSQTLSEIRIQPDRVNGPTRCWALWQSMPTPDHMLSLAWDIPGEAVVSHSLRAADLTAWISHNGAALE